MIPRLLPRLLFVVSIAGAARSGARDIAAPSVLPAVVDTVEVEGEWRTQPSAVLRELPWKPGQLVTPSQWDLGIVRLWNTLVFSRVEGRIEEREGRRVAIISVEEKWTTIPVFRFSRGGGLTWIRTGIYDINVFGQFVEMGALYETFTPNNGGSIWFRNPRLFGTRNDLYSLAELVVRPRPGFILRRLRSHTDLWIQSSDVQIWGLELQATRDGSQAPASGAYFAPPDAMAISVAAQFRLGRVDYIRIRADGQSFEMKAPFGISSAVEGGAFGQVFAEALLFRLFGDRWNVGARVKAGISTPVPRQDLFYVGGLDMIRGYPDSHLRASSYALLNLETRFTLFDSEFVAVQAAAFFDGAVAREPADPTRGTAFGSRAVGSVGGGLRFLLPRILRSGLRIDGALALTPSDATPLSVGVFQFF